jgi:hypothetical protein
MREIKREVSRNDGIYPHNKGRVTQAEVLRRALVGVSTLQSKPHKTTTRTMLNKWLRGIAGKVVRGHSAIRRTVTGRADAWKARYEEIVNAWAVAELEFNETKHDVRELKKRICELEAEVTALRMAPGGGRVAVLHRV